MSLSNASVVPYSPAANIPRARKFYEEMVGLKVREEFAGGVVYECGNGSWVFMYPTPNAGTNKASTLFWSVDDVEAEVAALKARGVVFEEYDFPQMKTVNSIATGGGARTAWFKDTEGNTLAISQKG
jgi:predicted enzyme related to lactoylglutathione lyase